MKKFVELVESVKPARCLDNFLHWTGVPMPDQGLLSRLRTVREKRVLFPDRTNLCGTVPRLSESLHPAQPSGKMNSGASACSMDSIVQQPQYQPFFER